MADKPVDWWRRWECAAFGQYTTRPPVFAQRHDGRPPYGCTYGFRRTYLGNAYSLRYWPDEDRLVLVFKPSNFSQRDGGVAAERTMPDTKEELIAWCRMVIELSS